MRTIDPTDTVDTQPPDFTLEGTLHVHPPGKPEDAADRQPQRTESSPTSTTFVNGDPEPQSWVFNGPPSPGDITSSKKQGTKFDIVIGARDGWTYFYDGNKILAQMRTHDFYR